MTVKIAIAGAAGRMGQALIRVAGEGVEVVGGTERPGSPELGKPAGSGVISDSVAKAAANADAWIDFTSPAATVDALEQLKRTPVRAAIVGTTGLSKDDEARVTSHASRIAIVRARNFSLGVNLLIALVERATASLGPDWDIEISETHHNRKVDAPSGTALMIAEAAAKGRGQDLADIRTPPYDGITGARKQGSIGFLVSRSGGVIGDHEARIVSDEEMITLGHRALDRAVFARGAIEAAKWAVSEKPGLYSMRDVLKL